MKLITKNFQNNLQSNYTEQIKSLERSFTYTDTENKSLFWSNAELSMLYGSPLFEQATEEQKLALNHLAWVSAYSRIAESETEVTHYNQVTAGLYELMGHDYEIIARDLELETTQEKSHIHAFYKISYKTLKALLGDDIFSRSVGGQSSAVSKIPSRLSQIQSTVLWYLTEKIMGNQHQYTSPYLRQLKKKGRLATLTTRGFFHGPRGYMSQPVLDYFARNWGASPFLACNYFTLRYMANMNLKSHEHKRFTYCRELQKQGEKIPVPTAISLNHFFDEAFHTTTSLFLGRDLYRHLSPPNAYEKWVANLTIQLSQKNEFGLISGALVGRYYGDDQSMMAHVYRILQSPVFGLSAQGALEWVERCFCREHQGFYVNQGYHRALVADLRRITEDLDFLWPVNREMRIAAAGDSVERALKHNLNVFQRFSRALATG